MNCPRDHQPLQSETIHGARVDRCPRDGGMYLHAGELNRIAEPTEGDLELSTIEGDSFQHDDEYPPIDCPNDPGVMMKKVEFVIHTNIILDYCERCRGFWVDGRELTRINEEIADFNAAAKEIPDPPLVRLGQFFWNLPFPH